MENISLRNVGIPNFLKKDQALNKRYIAEKKKI